MNRAVPTARFSFGGPAPAGYSDMIFLHQKNAAPSRRCGLLLFWMIEAPAMAKRVSD
jgi:hypothetical protein